MEALQLCLQSQLEIKALWHKLQAKGCWKPSGAGETPAPSSVAGLLGKFWRHIQSVRCYELGE